jgi:uncharacterized membrane protein
MSAFISYPSARGPTPRGGLRFGSESLDPVASVQWLLRRNCSLAPRQLFGFYATLCALSLLIALAFWLHGATLVVPFAGLEVLAIGSALLVYARHAADGETIRLQPGRLVVQRTHGSHVEQVEFAPAWVRVEPETGDRSLIELSGQGRRIAVGRFIRPELRRDLADELRWALRRWRQRPTVEADGIDQEKSGLKWQP